MKAACLIFVFLAFFLTGVISLSVEKRKIKLLSALVGLLRHIETEILNYRRELEDIFLSYDSPLLDSSGFSENLGSCGFEEAVRLLSLGKNEENILTEFSKKLGLLPAPEQGEECRRAYEALEQILKVKKAEYPEKRRLYIGLGIMLGAMAVIIGL